MGNFSNAVQNDAVVGPLRSDFKRGAWQAEYSRLADDDIDKDLLDAGLLILEKANSIRANLRVTFSKGLKATTKVRAFAAVGNHDFCVVTMKTREVIAERAENQKTTKPGVPVMAHELAAVKLELPIGAEYSPEEIVQSIVDGLQVPLKRILEVKPDLAGNPQFGKLDWKEVCKDFNLGVLYSYVEGLWDDCLWNNYRARNIGKHITFSPREISWQVHEAISRVRYGSLATEFAVHALHLYESLLYSSRRYALGSMCVISVKRTGERHEIELGAFDGESEAVKHLLTMRSYASEPYYTELLNEAQPILKGASLNQLLTAWAVTSSVSDLLRQEVEAMETTKPEDPKAWLPKYAPVLQIGALVRAVAAAAACSQLQATAVIEFLIFRGKKDQELWAQPLLPVNKEAVVPLFAATCSPNLRRLVDVWLGQLGVDLSLRGHAFEAHVRASIRNNIKCSPLLSSSSACLEKHLKFTPDGEREEEIDIVALVGDILIVGEAKCFLEPAEAKEIARHREKVRESVTQVKRKASAVERHKQAFRQRASEEGLALPEEFRVQPLVILNNAIHVGIPVETVPIVDEYILGVFFRGQFVEMALKQPNKSFDPIKTRILYRSPEEAAKCFQRYLAEPPQMESLLKGISWRWVPVLGVTENDWVGQFLAISCVRNVGVPVQDSVQSSPSEA